MRRAHRVAGFTLVEVLIGTTVLSIMLGLLMSAFFAMGQSARAGASRLDDADTTRVVYAFLRGQLSQAVPLTHRFDGHEHALFDGEAARLRFVGHLPAHRGGGGLQILDLALLEKDTSLVLRHRPAWPELAWRSSVHEGEWSAEVLATGISDVKFSYFGDDSEGDQPRWRDRWRDFDRLPSLVRLEWTRVSGHYWPALTTAIRTRTALAQPALLLTQDETAP